MGTKDNPRKFDCYAKLESNEPYFVLMGRDPCAANAVNSWCDDRIEMLRRKYKNELEIPTSEFIQLKEARDCAVHMSEYAHMWKQRKVEPRLDYYIYPNEKDMAVLINGSTIVEMKELIAFWLKNKDTLAAK